MARQHDERTRAHAEPKTTKRSEGRPAGGACLQTSAPAPTACHPTSMHDLSPHTHTRTTSSPMPACLPLAMHRTSHMHIHTHACAPPLQDELKKMVGYKAVDDYVESGMLVGLGTGSTAAFAVERLVTKFQGWRVARQGVRAYEYPAFRPRAVTWRSPSNVEQLGGPSCTPLLPGIESTARRS